MADAGLEPDKWQRDLLRGNHDRILLLASRQSGKSQTAAALALKEALLYPDSLVLLLSPTLRQSGELFRDKVMRLYNALGRPIATVRETALEMMLANESRIVCLPGEEKTVVGYSNVKLLVLDEAAQIEDELYHYVRPMLAISRGKLIALTTPRGQRGFFHEEWTSQNAWERVRITADQCLRIDPAFLREELLSKGERFFKQEYFCSFESVVGALFSEDVIQAMLSSSVERLDLL
jgi:hypothetical protein